MDAPPRIERAQLDKLCTSIRGKLQFMDYLVRAAVADIERYQAENDGGTQIFLRQLIEMHANNLSQECDNMRLIGDLCAQLHTNLGTGSSPVSAPGSDFGVSAAMSSVQGAHA